MVITGLTRNQFVPKAHEGSNPSLCAKKAVVPSRYNCFSSFGAEGVDSNLATSVAGFAFERKPSGSLLTSGGAINLRVANTPPSLYPCGTTAFLLFGAEGVDSNLATSVAGFAYAHCAYLRREEHSHLTFALRNSQHRFTPSSISLPALPSRHDCFNTTSFRPLLGLKFIFTKR